MRQVNSTQIICITWIRSKNGPRTISGLHKNGLEASRLLLLRSSCRRIFIRISLVPKLLASPQPQRSTDPRLPAMSIAACGPYLPCALDRRDVYDMSRPYRIDVASYKWGSCGGDLVRGGSRIRHRHSSWPIVRRVADGWDKTRAMACVFGPKIGRPRLRYYCHVFRVRLETPQIIEQLTPRP